MLPTCKKLFYSVTDKFLLFESRMAQLPSSYCPSVLCCHYLFSSVRRHSTYRKHILRYPNCSIMNLSCSLDIPIWLAMCFWVTCKSFWIKSSMCLRCSSSLIMIKCLPHFSSLFTDYLGSQPQNFITHWFTVVLSTA